ncbi:MAG: hypothetical protein JRI46_00440 [Deltaproteobacteria bacterium]|nr:hypothetical protein [Deltaproteobacteria bacterium]
MPPPSVPRRVEDIIFYYYAKLVIAPSAGFGGNYGFIIDAYKRLKSGEIRMSDYERELLHIAEVPNICAFCESRSANCKITHIVSRSFGIKPGMHNIVYACETCCASKGEKDLGEWWCKDLKRPRDEIPRVPLGLYLKIAYELHKVNFSLRKSCQSLEKLFRALE